MPRTEVYQLRLTKDEKTWLAEKAKTQGISIARLIRYAVELPGTRFAEVTTLSRPDEPEYVALPPDSHEAAAVEQLQANAQFAKLVKQLEAQGKPDPEGEARRRLGLSP